MITMEFIEGVSLMQTERLGAGGYNLKLIARTISEAFTQQLYRHGFIHSDPHQVFTLPCSVGKHPHQRFAL